MKVMIHDLKKNSVQDSWGLQKMDLIWFQGVDIHVIWEMRSMYSLF